MREKIFMHLAVVCVSDVQHSSAEIKKSVHMWTFFLEEKQNKSCYYNMLCLREWKKKTSLCPFILYCFIQCHLVSIKRSLFAEKVG